MRFLPKSFRFSPKITILCVGLAIVMFWCSTWQWDRYKKKVELLATYEESRTGTAVPLSPSDLSDNALDALLHRVAHLKGTYDYQHQIIVTNREHASGPGHWLLTPLKLEGSDQHVIVSRGFIPFADREPNTWGKYNFAEVDEFDAVVKPSSSQTMFGPSNPKVSSEMPFPTMFFYPDIGHFAKQLPYPVVQSVFFQRLGQPAVGEFPAQSILVEVPPQTHFGYTIEWALLGLATLTICFLIQAFPRQRRLRFTNFSSDTRPD